MRSCCVVGARIVVSVMYSRAFFIRAIARVKYPRVYSRHHNDLRVMSTSSKTRRAVPHWKRVAKSRRECFQSSDAAVRASFAATDTQHQSALFLSPSQLSTVCVAASSAASRLCITGSALRFARVEAAGVRRLMRMAPVRSTVAASTSMLSVSLAAPPLRATISTCLHEAV